MGEVGQRKHKALRSKIHTVFLIRRIKLNWANCSTQKQGKGQQDETYEKLNEGFEDNGKSKITKTGLGVIV